MIKTVRNNSSNVKTAYFIFWIITYNEVFVKVNALKAIVVVIYRDIGTKTVQPLAKPLKNQGISLPYKTERNFWESERFFLKIQYWKK